MMERQGSFSTTAEAKKARRLRDSLSTLNSHEGGKHLALNFEGFYRAFLGALCSFVYSLDKLCRNDKLYEHRLRKVLMTHAMKPAP